MESPNQTSVSEFIFLAFSKKSTKYPIFFITIFLLLFSVIICGNLLMILVIKCDARLHTPMYFFVFSLSCLDICYITTIVPQALHNLMSIKSSIFYLNCAFQMFFSNTFGAVQIMIITVMAYDRYIAISNPLRYKTIMSWAACSVFLGIAWIIGIIIGFLVVFSVFTLPFCCRVEIEHFYCDVGQIMALSSADEFRLFIAGAVTFLTGIFFFSIPFILLVISYAYIISAVLKIRTSQGRRKAFSTCSSHLTVVVVEYACLGFIYFRPREAYTLDKDNVFVLIFTFTTPILNPVIYTLRNKAIKKGFFKLTSTKLC
uniref:G-protein coupled receptors family 1 profile domain-containing protein n=1 Tax=Pyxicephalus adspersus TaxID=30357 RepID=A0AAV3AG15_PYXAD|nr:TPA: hypothetical protein GDO54_010245 [Pyxicephalus adspersus]